MPVYLCKCFSWYPHHSFEKYDDLTIDQVIVVYRTIMEKSGGDKRLISEANLHQMVFWVDGASGALRKAAMATYLIVAFPSFREGNKRTACGVLKFNPFWKTAITCSLRIMTCQRWCGCDFSLG